MLLIGHRGAPAHEPENTLRSFDRAIAMGADMLEIDVHILPAGELVVFHDRSLDRTTNGKGMLLRQSFQDLRKLDAGNGERIPTLQEVLDVVDKRVPVVIEIKSSGAGRAVAECIEYYVKNRGWRYTQFLVCSFDHFQLHEFKTQHAPHIAIAASTASIPLELALFAEELQALAVVSDIDSINRAFVDDAHTRGLKVLTFTILTHDDTLLMHELGVDGIFTNELDVSRAALSSVAAA
jgi:glycerophosphoryl diester phosphodiesterase